jgi:chromosome partitioning protein
LINHSTIEESVCDSPVPGMSIVPSHINLVGAELELLNMPQRERRMEALFAPVRDLYDYIIIDCSPSLGLITVNALTAADSVIIPVQAEYFALEGISKLLNTIKIIKAKLNTRLEIEGFLLTMYDSRLRLANQIYEELKGHFGRMVFDTVIQRNIRLSEAPSHGLPVVMYDSESRGSINHMQLAKELIKRNNDK